MSLDKIANILGQETIKKIYEDGVSEPVKEVSKIGVDIIKAVRLFTAPIQLASAYQDRLTVYLEKVRNNVKEENQIEAPASISGPILEKLKYLEDENYLTDLYLNLLSRAIDKERINEAHPAFFHIIDQLSPDEAYFLFLLKDKDLELVVQEDFDNVVRRFSNYRISKSELPMDKFNFPANFQMYYSHLESLNLINWPVLREEYPKNEKGEQNAWIRHTKIMLSDFGKLFVKACIPEKGFMFYNA